MKKVLVTGASGFVGGFLVEECLKRGLEVFAAVRPSSDLTYLQDQRIQCLQVNLADVEAMTALFRQHQFDYFIHNAGLTKGSREAMFKVNTQLCDNILKALQEGIPDLKKFVFISSLAAYGPADQQRADEVKEADEPRPITSYGESKLAAEKLLHATSDFPWLVFRPTAVYGPREKDIFTFFSLINKGIEPYIGFQTQQLTFVYVLDLVRVIVDGLLSEHRQKSYFVSDGQAYAALQLGQYIRQ
ncbi:MAG: NAD(P)-dependent oxidoreductase, partial [Bacteroidota bacterium]